MPINSRNHLENTGVLAKKIIFFYSRHACISILKIKGLRIALAEVFFKKYTGKKAYQNRVKKLEEIRKLEVITVVFQVWNLAKWKSDSVYKAMAKHPRFQPVIWITDDPTSPLHEKRRCEKKWSLSFRIPNIFIIMQKIERLFIKR